MSEKPEALALADAISYPDVPLGIEAAAELRRQHEEIERLTKENERLRDELRQSSIDITRAEVERLREELAKPRFIVRKRPPLDLSDEFTVPA